MDFGYKVIRNRLGSLVANAIQKKIDNNKGGEPFIVLVESDGNGNFTTTINSSKVIQAINENKLVIYKLVIGNQIGIGISTLIFINQSNISFLMFSGTQTMSFSHIGTTISLIN